MRGDRLADFERIANGGYEQADHDESERRRILIGANRALLLAERKNVAHDSAERGAPRRRFRRNVGR